MVCYMLSVSEAPFCSNSPWLGPGWGGWALPYLGADSLLQAWQQELGSGRGAGQPGSGQVMRPQKIWPS